MRLLLLAGTGEARRIAKGLRAGGVDAVASLAGVTAAPAALALPVRVGGFGGAAGMRAWMEGARIGAVVDATHPHAARISARAARLCGAMGLPYCRYLRPPWEMEPGWTALASEAALAGHLPKPAVIFLATGRQSLSRFSGLERHRVHCRVVDAPSEPFPLPRGGWIVGRPGRAPEAEAALFRELEVDWLVVKNSGGTAGRAKLEAARQLGLRVGVIARPPRPHVQTVGPTVATVEAALDWAFDWARALPA